MSKKNPIFLAVVMLCFFFLTGCQKQAYSYSNLLDVNEINELQIMLSEQNVPENDVSAFITFLRDYSNSPYGKEITKGWQTATVGKSLYNYSSAINAYTANPFADINCRQAAFLLCHNFITIDSGIDPSMISDELSAFTFANEDEYSKYEALFGSVLSTDDVSESLQARWGNVGVNFSDTFQLVSLWGSADETITHLHCGVLFTHENQLYFIEKTDPYLPFQISIFESTEILKAYLLDRTNAYQDVVVFINYYAL